MLTLTPTYDDVVPESDLIDGVRPDAHGVQIQTLDEHPKEIGHVKVVE